MNDISALRECWPETEAPSPGAQEQARVALLTRISQPAAPATPARTRRLPSWAWRAGLATTASAALVAGVVVGFGSATTPGKHPEATAPATNVGPLELAAVRAAGEPFTPPRPDQWIYLETRVVGKGGMARSKGSTTDVLQKIWKRADGKQSALLEKGKIKVYDNVALRTFPPQDYPSLAGIPTEPQALLGWLRKGIEPNAHTSAEELNAAYFSFIGTILSQNLLPPKVNAALLRAADRVPGVTRTPGTVTIDGRAAVAVGRVQDGWRQEDLLLDPKTHEFIGSRAVAVKPYTFTVEEGPVDDPTIGPTIHIPKGEVQYEMTRGDSQIVDAPGQTS